MEDKETALYDAYGFPSAHNMVTLYTKLRKRQENKMAYEKRKAEQLGVVAAATAAAAAATTAAVAAEATLPISSDALAVVELQTSKRGLEDRG